MPSLFENINRTDRGERYSQPLGQPTAPLLPSNTAAQAGGFFGDALAGAGGYKDPNVQLNETIQGKIRELKGKGVDQNSPEFYSELGGVLMQAGMLKEGQELAKVGFDLEKHRVDVENTGAQTENIETKTESIGVELSQTAVRLQQGYEDLAIRRQQANTQQERNELEKQAIAMRETIANTQAATSIYVANERTQAAILSSTGTKPKNASRADVDEMSTSLKMKIKEGLLLKDKDGEASSQNDISPEELNLLSKAAADRARLYEAQGMDFNQAKTQAEEDVLMALEAKSFNLSFEDDIRFNRSAMPAASGKEVDFNSLP